MAEDVTKIPGFNMPIDSKILILGSSSISNEDYLSLANDIGDGLAELYTLIWDRALNPADTSAFVNSIENRPNKDELIYRRAIKCIDNAEYVIIDISQASTGMGLEVGYLLSSLATEKKYISFIAKKGSKISPHITGMYKHVTGNDAIVEFYEEPKHMIGAVRRTPDYESYSDKINIERAY